MRPFVPFLIVALLSFVVANAARLNVDPMTGNPWDPVLDTASSSRMVGAICMPMLVSVFLLLVPKSALHFILSIVGFLAFFMRPILDVTISGAAFGDTWHQLLDLIALASSLAISTGITTLFIAFSKPILRARGHDLVEPCLRIWHLLFLAAVFATAFSLIAYVCSSTFQASRSPFNALAILRVGLPVTLSAALSIIINLALSAVTANAIRRIFLSGVVLVVLGTVSFVHFTLERAWQSTLGLYVGTSYFWDGIALPILGATLTITFVTLVLLSGFETGVRPEG